MPLPQPELPEPAHPTVDSMLSRKFGKEVANYFSGVSILYICNKCSINTSKVPHSTVFLSYDPTTPSCLKRSSIPPRLSSSLTTSILSCTRPISSHVANMST
jgi:hypothetical protein